MTHPLDNPIWNALTAGQADLAEVSNERAGRYQRGISPFGALIDPKDPAAWRALGDLLEGHGVVLLIDPADVPTGWDVIGGVGGVQMEGTGLAHEADPTLVTLQRDDVPEMLALVEQTRPGPFLERTIDMGTYLGIRRGTELIAMAGERVHPPGWTELSAVCTGDNYRGQGLAARLVRALAAGIRDRDEQPFLHAADTNTNAIRLYEWLGFTIRRTLSFTAVREKSKDPD